MSDDVAIVGLGMHPFGRHEGVTGLQMAAVAARRALADAGIGWEQVDFAAGGSDAGGNADTSVSALVLARGPRIRELASRPVYLRSVAFRTRRFGSFEVFSPSVPIESAPSPTTEAAAAAFEQAGVAPEDVDVAQLQDTESGAEVMHLAETGLCEHGEQYFFNHTATTEI